MIFDLKNYPKISNKLEKLSTSDEWQLIGPLEIYHAFCPSQLGLSTIYVDGGLRHKKNSVQKNSISIGDGDSHEGRPEDIDILVQKEKDQSDLALALSLLGKINSACSTLKLYGFYGGRLDHQLAIFGELRNSLSHFKFLERIDLYGPHSAAIKTTLLKKSMTFNSQNTFSLTMFEETMTSISGQVKYPLSNHNVGPFSSLSLSNQARGQVEITVDKPALIHFNEA